MLAGVFSLDHWDSQISLHRVHRTGSDRVYASQLRTTLRKEGES
jgi:hypothetical protein